MDPVTGSLIGSGVSTAGSMFGSLTGNRSTRELSREIRKWNLEQWHRQNEYNTPTNQLKRMREAGLNPQLMYGQGSPGNADAVRSVGAPRMSGIDIGDPIGTFYDLKAKSAQVRNIEADAEMNEANARYASERADLLIRQLGHNTSTSESESTIKYLQSLVEQQMADPKGAHGRDIHKRKYGRGVSYDNERNVQSRVKKAEVINRELEARLKRGHAEMRDMGLEPGDKMWYRILNQVLQSINKKYKINLPLPSEAN